MEASDEAIAKLKRNLEERWINTWEDQKVGEAISDLAVFHPLLSTPSSNPSLCVLPSGSA